jgi:putative ABC transport system permease protein
MLKYLPLILANLERKRLRTMLIVASIAIAFALFGLLESMRASVTDSSGVAGGNRLITQHKVSIVQSLPASYLERIRGVEGVHAACSHNWFGGIYQSDQNQIPVFAVDTESFFAIYPEYELPEQQRKAWLADTSGALVGKLLAARFGWKVGDRIPLRSDIFQKAEGGDIWEVNISGIYEAGNEDDASLYFHYKYFNNSLRFGRDRIGWVVIRIDDPQQGPRISSAVDQMFANSSAETKTATERAFAQTFINQRGNVSAIVAAVAAAVFFTMLLVSANGMAQAIRERTSELAVMRTLGFSAVSLVALVLGEAIVLNLLGVLVGLGIAALLVVRFATVAQEYFPSLSIPRHAYLFSVGLAVLFGVFAGALPCFRIYRLQIVNALRRR